jgi:formate dehydrogenase (coenzyme F420) beta subunit
MNSKLIDNIKGEIRKAFKEKKVDLVIGYEAGSIPYKTKPLFIKGEKDIDKIVWNSFCNINLARYLVKYPDKKIGIVAKGCDTRAIVSLIKEKKIIRDQIYIIGVVCDGMIAVSDIDKKVSISSINSITEENNKIIISEEKNKKEFSKDEMINISCKDCNYPNPVISDVLIGEKRKTDKDRFKKVKDFEKLSDKERNDYFKQEFEKCIRCYACKEVCPVCYCKECFTESSDPKWIDTGTESTDKSMYLIIRAFHMIGRCVDCGACNRICPKGVDLNIIMNKIASDLKENYQFEAGINIDDKIPLVTYNENDFNDFIL